MLSNVTGNVMRVWRYETLAMEKPVAGSLPVCL